MMTKVSEPTPHSRHSGYRPEIDGLRAIAVLGVLLFHTNLGCPGGYVGVDVFFVISGFLITGVIRRALDQGSFSMVDFWTRRVRRIYPASITMVICTLAAGSLWLLPKDLQNLGYASIAQSLFVANHWFQSDVGYFAGPADLKPLLHTWSLAVEEQFYFVFPFILVLLRNRSGRQVFQILFGLALCSFLLSVYRTSTHPTAAFFFLPGRAWELLMGCLLSVYPGKIKSRPRFDAILGALGLAAISGSMLIMDKDSVFPGFGALPATLGTAATIYSTGATSDSWIRRLLSIRPLVFVGLISYSLYLWHWPVLAYYRYMSLSPRRVEMLALLAVVGVLATSSWYFIERPFRLQKRFSNVGIWRLAGAVTMLIIVLGSFFAFSKGMPSRFPNNLRQLAEDVHWLGDVESLPLGQFREDEVAALGQEIDSTGRPDFCLWGDSHARVFAGILNEEARRNQLSGLGILTPATPPLPGLIQPHQDERQVHVASGNEELFSYIVSRRPRVLLLSARWSLYCEGRSDLELQSNESWERYQYLVAGQDSDGSPDPEESATSIQSSLSQLLERCHAKGIKVFVLKQVPETGEFQPAKDFFNSVVGRFDRLPDGTATRKEHLIRQRRLNEVFSGFPRDRVTLISADEAFFDADERTINYSSGRSIYRDDNHLTRHGAEKLRPQILQLIELIVDLKQSADNSY